MHFFAKKDFTAATVSVANYCNLFLKVAIAWQEFKNGTSKAQNDKVLGYSFLKNGQQ